MRTGSRPRALALALAVALLTSGFATLTSSGFALWAPAAPAAAELAEGQEWRYRTRPQEPHSTLLIARIDEDGGGRVVHVSVARLRLQDPRQPGGLAAEVPHLAFDEAALRASLVELLGAAPPAAGFARAYEQWRRHHAGIHRVPVAQALDRLEDALIW